jgi:hypothetical protein
VGRKRKGRKFRKVEAVKALARERVGAPPPSQVVPNRRKKESKHRATLAKLLSEE